jgi:hypothetical protein
MGLLGAGVAGERPPGLSHTESLSQHEKHWPHAGGCRETPTKARLMTISEVLNAAIAGGYHIDGSDGVATSYSGANDEYSAWTRTDNHSTFLIPVQETFLDPAFWQALGQTLGWNTPCDLAITCVHGTEECRRCDGTYWMYQWHCFIQHLANGEAAEAFFARLPVPRRPAARPANPDTDWHRHSTEQ